MKSDNFEVILYSSWFSNDRLTIQQNDYDSYRLEIGAEKIDELIRLLIEFKLSYNNR